MRFCALCILVSAMLLPGLLPAQGAPASGAKKTEAEKEAGFEGNKRSKGVMIEFRKLEEDIRRRRRGASVRQKTLENNLVRAMSRIVFRMFYPEREELLKDLNAKTLVYDNPTSPLVYYVKYDTKKRLILVRFDYARDPEYYLQTPAFEKMLIRDKEEEKKHDKPATGGGNP